MKLEKALIITAFLSVILAIPVSKVLQKAHAAYAVEHPTTLRLPFDIEPEK